MEEGMICRHDDRILFYDVEEPYWQCIECDERFLPKSEIEAERKASFEDSLCMDCGGPNLRDPTVEGEEDCICGGSGLRTDQIKGLKGLKGCIQYWRKEHETERADHAETRRELETLQKEYKILSDDSEAVQKELAETREKLEKALDVVLRCRHGMVGVNGLEVVDGAAPDDSFTVDLSFEISACDAVAPGPHGVSVWVLTTRVAQKDTQEKYDALQREVEALRKVVAALENVMRVPTRDSRRYELAEANLEYELAAYRAAFPKEVGNA
jgi:hypothetical protein